MDPVESIGNVRDLFSVKHVFGEPVEREGVTLVPVARIRGGGGAGGSPKTAEGAQEGAGIGFGMSAKPAGAFELRGGKARFRPAIDVNRIVFAGEFLLGLAIICSVPIVRALARRDAFPPAPRRWMRRFRAA